MFYLQESCARMLLFRGADKECLNYAGQTAYQVRNVSQAWRGYKSYLDDVFCPAKYSSDGVEPGQGPGSS